MRLVKLLHLHNCGWFGNGEDFKRVGGGKVWVEGNKDFKINKWKL
jgi:hypothetical protein